MNGAEVSDLELRQVTKRYRDVVAVENLSFSVARGEFVTLLGPSGGGKSSTLRIIAGFLRPDSGQVLLRGQPVGDVPPYDRDIGVVFQNYALFPHMTVEANVAFGLRMRRVPRREMAARVREALGLVRLGDHGGRYPHQLSGGQQQRVALARALVIRPSLLLLDEPMSNLDAALRASMQLEVRQIVERVGVTTVSVTHNQEEALSMSDRVVVMSHGRIEQVGPPLDVYERPANEFVASFVGRSNLIRCRVVARDERVATTRTDSGEAVTVSTAALPDGDSLLLLVRPESIAIGPPGRSGTNCFEGRVSQVAFLGAAFEYSVNAAGQTLLVQQPAGRERARFRAGDAVTLHWDPAVAVGLRPAA